MWKKIKERIDAAARGIVRAMEAAGRGPASMLALSLVLTLAIEIAGRHSLVQGVAFLFGHPVRFLANAAIVWTTCAAALFFSRRAFALAVAVTFWIGMGITNAVVLLFRVSPFGMIDIELLPSISDVFYVYLEPPALAGLIVCVVLAVVLLGRVFAQAPRHLVRRRRALCVFAGVVLSTAAFYALTVVGHEDERADSFSNIADAYDDYGFVYCFCTGAVDQGIDEPVRYSRTVVSRLLAGLEPGNIPEALPNIVMVQLESFFDVGNLDDVHCEENPVPVFTALKRDFSHGFLTVPSVGAGTANTEFEVLSGMSVGFFGMGEYPYKTVLRDRACGTVATDLKALGYTASALHNNEGAFYGRDVVLAQLGFDAYTPIEFMEGVEYNPIGWAKDAVLTGQIAADMDASPGPDFVFAITVQGHGKYQRGEDSPEAESLDVEWDDGADETDALAYYLSQLEETDAFLGELVDTLQARGEPTVLVAYGDHLPAFDIGSEHLKSGDVFKTEYVLWDNIGLEKTEKDLAAYQLSAEVMRRVGIGGGLLSRYHQQRAGTTGYLQGLGLLEYDMLYGKCFCYGGKNPFTASDMRIGPAGNKK